MAYSVTVIVIISIGNIAIFFNNHVPMTIKQ